MFKLFAVFAAASTLCLVSGMAAAQSSAWPASKVTPKCSDSFYAMDGDGDFSGTAGTALAYGIVVTQVNAGAGDWVEMRDSQAEWASCTTAGATAGDIILIFTRAGAAAVPFLVECSASSSSNVAGVYQAISLRSSDTTSITGGARIASILLGHSIDVDVSVSGIKAFSISGVVSLDDGDCVGMTAATGFLGGAFTFNLHSATCRIRELDSCI